MRPSAAFHATFTCNVSVHEVRWGSRVGCHGCSTLLQLYYYCSKSVSWQPPHCRDLYGWCAGKTLPWGEGECFGEHASVPPLSFHGARLNCACVGNHLCSLEKLE